jgi:hypothetical protein
VCFDEFESEFGFGIGIGQTPSRQTRTSCGYDKHCYISTAALAASPYTSQALIQAKIGGLIRLIEACDDAQPPTGNFLDPGVQAVYNAIIQNVTTEINGYLSSIYPIPLMQTGTPAIVQVATLTTDGLNGIASLTVIEGGNYLAAPVSPNNPVYLRHIDPLANASLWGDNWENCQTGTGAQLTVAFQNTPFTDENGTTVQAQTLNGTPTITAEGTNYNVGDLLVLVGGQSFVPAKIREAALILICHSFYQRRLAPEEKNLFEDLAKMWRKKLIALGNGDDEFQLDATFKRNFSIGAMWGQRSVLFNSNSL